MSPDECSPSDSMMRRRFFFGSRVLRGRWSVVLGVGVFTSACSIADETDAAATLLCKYIANGVDFYTKLRFSTCKCI